jgi:hypothetical protein
MHSNALETLRRAFPFVFSGDGGDYLSHNAAWLARQHVVFPNPVSWGNEIGAANQGMVSEIDSSAPMGIGPCILVWTSKRVRSLRFC